MNLRDELLGVRARRGVLTPEVVVDEARPEDAPLHDRFEWDDGIAGEAWRRLQAHQLIQSVRIKQRDADGKVARDLRAFHAVRNEATGGFTYEPAEEVALDPMKRAIVLADMEREWKTLRARYVAFDEFAEMILRDLGEEAAA